MKLFDADTVAGQLGLDCTELAKWVRDGTIPKPHFVGGRVRWRDVELDRWADKGFPTCDPPDWKTWMTWRHVWMTEQFEHAQKRLTQLQLQQSEAENG